MRTGRLPMLQLEREDSPPRLHCERRKKISTHRAKTIDPHAD
jgi:hypothetical protein